MLVECVPDRALHTFMARGSATCKSGPVFPHQPGGRRAHSPRYLVLVLHAGDGLLEVAEEGVDVAQLPVGRPLGRRNVQLVRDDEPLLVAHQRLLQVADAAVRASKASIGALLVPRTLGL